VGLGQVGRVIGTGRTGKVGQVRRVKWVGSDGFDSRIGSGRTRVTGLTGLSTDRVGAGRGHGSDLT
jgi:hypothetical protein